MRIDHVACAVRDLAEADSFGARTGLRPRGGGRQQGWGTANRMVALGTAFLEFIAVVDASEADASPIGWRVAALAGGSRLAGWAIAVDDIGAVAARLGLAVVEGTRPVRADGTGGYGWRMVGLEEAFPVGLPFFVSWTPSPSAPHHIVAAGQGAAPRGFTWIEVGGDLDRLRNWLGGAAGFARRPVDGPPGPGRAGIALAGGDEIIVPLA